MLDVVDHMTTDLLVTWRRRCTLSLVVERVIFIKLAGFQFLSILPTSVAILAVNLDGLLVISGNHESKLVDNGCPIGPKLCLVGHAEKLLLTSCNPS